MRVRWRWPRRRRGCCDRPCVACPRSRIPNKPVKLMVGASPGGGTDIVARMLGKELAETMKQPFVVENKPGASNTIAADITAKSPPDGYTLLVATNTGQAIAPHLMKLGFDPLKDLTPVALVMVVPNVLIVGPAVTAKDVKRTGGADEGQAGHVQLRVVGLGQHAASRRRGVQEAGRRADDAHPVQGQQPGAPRPHLRQCAADVRHHVVGDRPDQGRQGAGAGGDVARSARRSCPTCRRSRKRAFPGSR